MHLHRDDAHIKGFSLVELLVGASIFSIFTIAIVVVFQSFLTHSFDSVEKVQASFLAEEGIEAMKSIRDRDWDDEILALSTNTNYYLAYENNMWSATTVPRDLIDGTFERLVVLEEVYRDGNDDIDVSGTDDPNTRKVIITVAWFAGSATTTQTLETYITNLND